MFNRSQRHGFRQQPTSKHNPNFAGATEIKAAIDPDNFKNEKERVDWFQAELKKLCDKAEVELKPVNMLQVQIQPNAERMAAMKRQELIKLQEAHDARKLPEKDKELAEKTKDFMKEDNSNHDEAKEEDSSEEASQEKEEG